MTETVVQTFRDSVDSVIEDQVKRAQAQHRSWHNYKTERSVGDLLYTSVEPNQSRLSIFGLSKEHLWGVTERNAVRQGAHLGSVAVISSMDEPEKLFRIFEASSGHMFHDLSVRSPLSEEQAEQAVAWARSPQIYGAEFFEAIALSDEELAVINGKAEVARQQDAELQAQLDDISRKVIRW